MGYLDISRERNTGRTKCLERPFVEKLPNGILFRIDSVEVRAHHSFRKLMEQRGKLEIKFCITDDENADSYNEDVEQWKVVMFPWYNLHGEENVHGEIVDYSDSILNGNLVFEGGEITHISTNHWDSDYIVVRKKILDFISMFILKHLRNQY